MSNVCFISTHNPSELLKTSLREILADYKLEPNTATFEVCKGRKVFPTLLNNHGTETSNLSIQ